MPTAAAVRQGCFSALCSHLRKWFSEPDIEALEVTLAVVTSHYYRNLDPVWIYNIGPSGSGKTSITINCCSGLPTARVMGDMSPSTFASGLKGRRNSLLHVLGDSAILLMKDFTTFLSKRPEQRMEIAACLWELYDGRYTKDVGSGVHVDWSGKITVIAATTPAIEREWAVMRDLGERFLNVRWSRNNGIKAAEMAVAQRGHEEEITEESKRLTLSVVSPDLLPKLPYPIPDEMQPHLFNLAEMTAQARARVIRDAGSRDIISVSEAELPTRIAKSLASIVSGYATMHHRSPHMGDLRLAIRVANDSIPHNRMMLLNQIPIDTYTTIAELSEHTRMPQSTTAWHLEEMEALRILTTTREGILTRYQLSDDFRALRKSASILHRGASPPFS